MFFITAKKRHWSERIFWTLAVITSIALCSYLVYDTWLKWQNTPVIVINNLRNIKKKQIISESICL